jgi:hypothetical protein
VSKQASKFCELLANLEFSAGRRKGYAEPKRNAATDPNNRVLTRADVLSDPI